MYPYNFRTNQKGINFREVFVAMPFADKYEIIYSSLIVPAIAKANEKLGFKGDQSLLPYRAKDDIHTRSGWINILEHLLTSQIVFGVLTGSNANVFYELGIAHATQPITRQILIAESGYEAKFDLKDLIYYEYHEPLSECIDSLSEKIKDAIEWYKLSQEKKVHQARMLIGPYDFEVLMQHGRERCFAIHTTKGKEEYEKKYGEGSFKKHISAITNLCHHGILGLDSSTQAIENGVNVSFSYHWTNLGNCILETMKLIDMDEVKKRRAGIPWYFE